MSLAELLFTMLLHQLQCENKEDARNDKSSTHWSIREQARDVQYVYTELGHMACATLLTERKEAAPGAFAVKHKDPGRAVAAFAYVGTYSVAPSKHAGFDAFNLVC